MPQIPNRDDAEKRLAEVIQRVQQRTREKLVRAMGNPPDARNIPESLWLEVERELSRETEALLVLFLVASGGAFTSWLDEHPEYPAARDALYQPEHFADIAARVGRAQSQRLAQQMTATSKQRLAGVGQKLNRVTTYSEALRNELESAGRMTPEAREAIRERVSTERGTTARELYDRTVESITSESRAEIAARTEVTQSTTLGETIVERRWRDRTPNLVLIHYWKHRFPGQPGHPCPEICVPLLNTPQNYWPAIHPDMPEVWDGPPGHVNCDCYTEVQIVTLSQAQRVPTMFPVGGKAASLVSKLLAASGQYLSTTSLPRHWPGAAFKKTSDCGANAPGGGGFQPGNDCAAGGELHQKHKETRRRWLDIVKRTEKLRASAEDMASISREWNDLQQQGWAAKKEVDAIESELDRSDAEWRTRDSRPNPDVSVKITRGRESNRDAAIQVKGKVVGWINGFEDYRKGPDGEYRDTYVTYATELDESARGQFAYQTGLAHIASQYEGGTISKRSSMSTMIKHAIQKIPGVVWNEDKGTWHLTQDAAKKFLATPPSA